MQGFFKWKLLSCSSARALPFTNSTSTSGSWRGAVRGAQARRSDVSGFSTRAPSTEWLFYCRKICELHVLATDRALKMWYRIGSAHPCQGCDWEATPPSMVESPGQWPGGQAPVYTVGQAWAALQFGVNAEERRRGSTRGRRTLK